MKVYTRTKQNSTEYYNVNIFNAATGFKDLGAEIIPYRLVNEIYDKVEKEDIVLDGIDQCNYIFDKFTKHPELCDYPEVLRPFMGRKIWTDTIDHFNTHPELWNCFVKPVSHKAFTGRIVREPKDLIGCGNQDENFEILCTDVIDIKREWRVFVRYDAVIDIRPYKGDWHFTYNPAIIDKALEEFCTWHDRPMACSLDFAVAIIGGREQTVFLEQNDAYALGSYGLYQSDYAKLITTRWAQIMNVEDEYKTLKTWS